MVLVSSTIPYLRIYGSIRDLVMRLMERVTSECVTKILPLKSILLTTSEMTNQDIHPKVERDLAA